MSKKYAFHISLQIFSNCRQDPSSNSRKIKDPVFVASMDQDLKKGLISLPGLGYDKARQTNIKLGVRVTCPNFEHHAQTSSFTNI